MLIWQCIFRDLSQICDVRRMKMCRYKACCYTIRGRAGDTSSSQHNQVEASICVQGEGYSTG